VQCSRWYKLMIQEISLNLVWLAWEEELLLLYRNAYALLLCLRQANGLLIGMMQRLVGLGRDWLPITIDVSLRKGKRY